MNRREFIEVTGGATGAAMFGSFSSLEAQAAAPAIGIQVGINTLFLGTFTYGRGIGGRQPRGNALPDHGKQEYDDKYHGGNFATPHPQYYKNTSILPEKAPGRESRSISQRARRKKRRPRRCVSGCQGHVRRRGARHHSVPQVFRDAAGQPARGGPRHSGVCRRPGALTGFHPRSRSGRDRRVATRGRCVWPGSSYRLWHHGQQSNLWAKLRCE